VKSIGILIWVFAFAIKPATAGQPRPSDLGPLANYFRHDCVGARGPRRDEVHEVFKRALAGDHSAIRTVIMHRGDFGTGDNEAWSELPEIFLRVLGDAKYAAFVVSQPQAVQDSALFLSPEQLSDFEHRFPKTSKLYHPWLSRQRRTSDLR
jgi:hypothetical protein